MIKNLEATYKTVGTNTGVFSYDYDVYIHLKVKDFPINVDETYSSTTTYCRSEKLDASSFLEYEYKNTQDRYRITWDSYGLYQYTYLHSSEDWVSLSFNYNR